MAPHHATSFCHFDAGTTLRNWEDEARTRAPVRKKYTLSSYFPNVKVKDENKEGSSLISTTFV